MALLSLFGCGFFGSAAVGIVVVNHFYSTQGNLPKRYTEPSFLVARSLLAMVGGGLAMAYGIDSPILPSTSAPRLQR